MGVLAEVFLRRLRPAIRRVLRRHRGSAENLHNGAERAELRPTDVQLLRLRAAEGTRVETAGIVGKEGVLVVPLGWVRHHFDLLAQAAENPAPGVRVVGLMP